MKKLIYSFILFCALSLLFGCAAKEEERGFASVSGGADGYSVRDIAWGVSEDVVQSKYDNTLEAVAPDTLTTKETAADGCVSVTVLAFEDGKLVSVTDSYRAETAEAFEILTADMKASAEKDMPEDCMQGAVSAQDFKGSVTWEGTDGSCVFYQVNTQQQAVAVQATAPRP